MYRFTEITNALSGYCALYSLSVVGKAGCTGLEQ